MAKPKRKAGPHNHNTRRKLKDSRANRKDRDTPGEFKKIKGNLYEVSWVDATSHTGWMEVEEALTRKPVIMHTVGYALEENKDYIKLVRSIEDKGGTIGDVFCIPTEWVQSKRRL